MGWLQVSSVTKFASLAGVAAASAAGAAGAVILLSTHAPALAISPPVALRAARAEAPIGAAFAPASSEPASQAIPKSSDGHFWAEGEVDGRSVRFLVDTGATAVALTPADAQKLGLRPADLHYSYKVVTAGGQTRAASVRLKSISVAGARLDNVDALVIETGLDTSLLGMTYLGRLASFEATRGELVLHP